MKKLIILLLLLTGFACADEDKRSSRSEPVRSVSGDTVKDTLPPGNIQQERDALQTTRDSENAKAQQEATDHSGRYYKEQQTREPVAGRCEYVDIDLNGTSDLCIVHDRIYVTVRYEKTGNNSANVFFVAPKKDEDPEKELPWENFDKNTPIAELQFEPGGTAKLDWKGFSIDGEVATDYAILGKKTLEGTYKKQ